MPATFLMGDRGVGGSAEGAELFVKVGGVKLESNIDGVLHRMQRRPRDVRAALTLTLAPQRGQPIGWSILLAVGWRPGHTGAHDAQAGRGTSWGHCPRTEQGRSAGEVRASVSPEWPLDKAQ